MFLSPDTINECTCGILSSYVTTANNMREEKKIHSLEKTMGFGSNLDFQGAGVDACDFFGFLSRYGGGKTPVGWGEAGKY